jgi:crotonobetainyl-CoA:carnitine CoA-transferase CaiB-like acyl-CoA transferase
MQNTQPLRGLRVIEFGNFIAGPFAGMLLADMGADVIKVEPTRRGDMARATPPFIEGESASFMSLNRNKRSIALDLKTPSGAEAAIRLIESADAVIENFRPGVMEALGLGADAMRARRPSLVYASVSGFGQTGAAREKAAVNLIIEAASGTLSVTGEPGQMPVRPGIQTGDMLGALFATYAVLSGLLGAARHGEGRHADVSLIEASVAAAAFETADYLATGEVPQPLGNRHRLTAPYQLFAAKHGRYMAIGTPNDLLFAGLCSVLKLDDLTTDPRFARYADRKKNEDALIPLVEQAVRQFDSGELLAQLEARGIPCSLVRNYEETLRGEEGVARKLVAVAPHARLGSYETVRNPILMDHGSPQIHRGAPVHGEHTEELLADIGYGANEIRDFLDAGAATRAPRQQGA